MYTILKKKSLIFINFLISIEMWIILPFLILPILTFLNCCLRLIQLTDSKHIVPFSITIFRKSFSITVFRKPFLVFLPPHALYNYPSQQKIAFFYTYVYRALHICSDPSNLSNEINYLKSLALSRGYNPSVIDKALNKLHFG